MAELRCPMCGKPNSDELEKCAFCGARLKPLVASSPENRPPIHPGEEPVKGKTTEFERIPPASGEKETIQPGEEPTKKDTAELEPALPSWLRDLRGQEDQPPPAESAKPVADEGLPPASEPESSPQLSDVKLPDWLAGLDSGAEEEGEIPEWLASIRDQSPIQPGTPAEEEPFPQSEETDWLGRLRQEEERKPAQPAGGVPPFSPGSESAAVPPLEGLPDWFPDLKSESVPAKREPDLPSPDETRPSEELPGWLADIHAEPDKGLAAAPAEGTPEPVEELPEWLAKLQAESKTPTRELPHVEVPFEESPDWLAKLQASAFTEEKPPAPSIAPEAEVPTEKAAPESMPPAEAPDWLGKLSASAHTEQERPAVSAFTPESAALFEEIVPPQEALDRQKELQAGVEAAPETPTPSFVPETEAPAEAIPDWLAEFEEGTTPAEVPTPAVPEETALPAGERESNLPMETPDWLSTLKPEQGEEKAPGGEAEKPEIAPAELPTWVQAMRPVEAVVDESEVPREEEKEETTVRGPLAGLSGVLPIGPGLGALRKPQTYSTKLQMTEGQQRHAASLERLVASESEPRPLSGQVRLRSARLLRWVIAFALILAVGLPVATGIHPVPGAVYPSELSATRDLINGLGANSPVLLVFDYEPALSGELEAAAAPVIDHLLFKGPRLAILSTSPTGPILAERFMKTTQASHGYQSGQGYVNLGYLAGGPAGVLGFAEDPPATAAYTVEGAPAWQTPPLQGIQKLSDFAAVIILTDNADTGRIWIEQAGPYLNISPMIMVISAQAEPMIRPYYDSQQVKGLVTGLAGGKAYEQANDQAFQGVGLARRYWDAFSVGLFLAVMMILVGGSWSAIAVWGARRRTVRAASNGGTPAVSPRRAGSRGPNGVRDGKQEKGA